MALDAYRAEKTEHPLAEIRAKAVDILERKVPKQGLSSDDPSFLEMTGYSTTSLTKWWDDHPVGTKGASLTTCNAFVGWVAKYLGAKKLLSRGLLQLDWADKDVKGSWIPVDPTGENRPGPGDFYAAPYIDKKGNIQKFGHVGVVHSFDGSAWTTVDSGQGGRDALKDFIKWRSRPYDPAKVTGWVDIERYFEPPTP